MTEQAEEPTLVRARDALERLKASSAAVALFWNSASIAREQGAPIEASSHNLERMIPECQNAQDAALALATDASILVSEYTTRRRVQRTDAILAELNDDPSLLAAVRSRIDGLGPKPPAEAKVPPVLQPTVHKRAGFFGERIACSGKIVAEHNPPGSAKAEASAHDADVTCAHCQIAERRAHEPTTLPPGLAAEIDAANEAIRERAKEEKRIEAEKKATT